MNADISEKTTSKVSREYFPGEEAERAILPYEGLKILQSTEDLL